MIAISATFGVPQGAAMQHSTTGVQSIAEILPVVLARLLGSESAAGSGYDRRPRDSDLLAISSPQYADAYLV
jgi:hypothetical protein